MAWIILAVLLACAFAILVLYERSVSPEARERLSGDPDTYRKCGRLRSWSVVPMGLTVVCYVLYLFYPLPVPLPEHFPWPWWLSIVLGVAVLAASGWVCLKGARAAGKETMAPRKQGTLYGGIYEKIRHPQWYEVFSWFALALLLHSPFLFLFSFLYLPVWVLMVQAEERDLVLRYGQPYIKYWRRTVAFLPRRKG